MVNSGKDVVDVAAASTAVLTLGHGFLQWLACLLSFGCVYVFMSQTQFKNCLVINNLNLNEITQ